MRRRIWLILATMVTVMSLLLVPSPVSASWINLSSSAISSTAANTCSYNLNDNCMYYYVSSWPYNGGYIFISNGYQIKFRIITDDGLPRPVRVFISEPEILVTGFEPLPLEYATIPTITTMNSNVWYDCSVLFQPPLTEMVTSQVPVLRKNGREAKETITISETLPSQYIDKKYQFYVGLEVMVSNPPEGGGAGICGATGVTGYLQTMVR